MLPTRYQAKNLQRADEKEQIDIQQQDKRRLEEEINQASAELRRGAEELRNEYRKVLHDFCECRFPCQCMAADRLFDSLQHMNTLTKSHNTFDFESRKPMTASNLFLCYLWIGILYMDCS